MQRTMGGKLCFRPRSQQTPCPCITPRLHHPHIGACSVLELKCVTSAPWCPSGVMNRTRMPLTPLQQDPPLSEYTNPTSKGTIDNHYLTVPKVRKCTVLNRVQHEYQTRILHLASERGMPIACVCGRKPCWRIKMDRGTRQLGVL